MGRYAFPFDEREVNSPPYTSSGSTDVGDAEMADGDGPHTEELQEEAR